MKKTKMTHRFIFFIVKELIKILEKFSFEKRSKITKKISSFLVISLKKRKNLIFTNIQNSFPEKNQNWHKRLLKENFDSLGRLLSEIIEVAHFDFQQINEHIIFKPSFEEVAKIYKGGGLYISGHFACWEWMIAAMGLIRKKYNLSPAYAFFKRQSNFLLNDYIEKMRKKVHIGILYADQNPKVALKILKNNGFIAFCADQHAGGSGMVMPFLNRLASIHRGPAYFARLSNVKNAYFVWAYYQNQFTVHEVCSLPLPQKYDRKEQPKLWEEEFTFNWVRLLEEKVRQYPQSYFWIHNRWKVNSSNPQEIFDYWNHFENLIKE